MPHHLVCVEKFTLPYLTVPCAAAMRALRRLRRSGGRGMPMAVRTMVDAVAMCSASRSWRCLACTSAIPISSSQRSSATSWLLPTRPYARSTSRGRGSFKEDQHTQASLTCVCLSLRLFVRTVWRRSRRRLRSRSSNENRKRRMLRRRLLSIDRPPQAKKIWGLRRIVVR